MISTICGTPVSCLGVAAYPDQDPRIVGRAAETGVNFFFVYSLESIGFIQELKSVVQKHRHEMIVACGSESRTKSALREARSKILCALGTDAIDIFFAEYINPDDDAERIFGSSGVLDELQQWKVAGSIRFVGASAHDRNLATRLALDPRVDVLMQRFNMAHRKAKIDAFPAAMKTRTPIIAFTATRWGTLLKPHTGWAGQPPTAADCYRYCLAQPAVRLVLSAPKNIAEFDENLKIMSLPSMDHQDCQHWEHFGDIVYNHGGAAHEYESRWP